MSVLCVIPARYGSTRLPGKPLLEIKGKPLVMWAYDAATSAGVFDTVCVATDHDGILQTVQRHGGMAVMTSPDHERGTDRVYEVALKLAHDFVVNLQGDEPRLPADLLRDFVDALVHRIDDNSLLTTVSNATIGEKDNPNVVKVVLNARQEALYFSRAPIPYDCAGTLTSFHRHTGIYGFSHRGLGRFCGFGPGVLERNEKLEQLRALENGMRILCLVKTYDALGIDTPEDLRRFRATVEQG
jgi:3-deoxy-manno-octulosonate cytidylyltransferase (CMP-KDO synthetase)